MKTFYAGDQVCFKLIARDLRRNIIDLTGATVVMRYKAGTAAAVENAATVTDAAAGRAEVWITIPSTAGEFWWEWTITTGGHPATGPQVRRKGIIVSKLA